MGLCLSPRAVWAKTPVVTGVVVDGNECVASVWGLQGLVDGGGA